MHQLSTLSLERRTRWVGIAACALLFGALAFRATFLTSTALWVDEAESGVNALTILERGYPGDSYLGIPIFENMLIRTWPDNPEYEFKDISYSDRGMAVYHGWLPLYAIAASFKIFGIEPAKEALDWEIESTIKDLRRRTIAARLPSMVFSAVFLILMFIAGRTLAGNDAALPVLVIAGLSSSAVAPTLYARYYVYMLAFNAAGLLTLWRIVSRGARRDYAWHAAVLVILFYTHLLAFANLVVLTSLMVVLQHRSWQAARRWSVALFAVIVCAAPWLAATGYVQHLRHMPSGLALLRFPDDLLGYAFSRHTGYLILLSVGICWLALAWVRHGATLPARLREPWLNHRRQYFMLLSWMAIVMATYFLVSPPASLFPERLSLALFVPGFLFMAMTLADATRTITRSLSVFLTPAMAIAFLAVSGLLRAPDHDPKAFEKLNLVFDRINQFQLRPDAKVYAAPANNHILTFYSDKPIQSVAPVRKSFLDSYPGEVLYIEQQFMWQFTAPTTDDIRDAAKRMGLTPAPAEVDALHASLESRYARERTAPLVAEVVPPLRPLSPLAAEVMEETRRLAEVYADGEEKDWVKRRLPFARGCRIRESRDLWQRFFYRLVDPVARGGESMNATERLYAGRAYVVPEAFQVFFYSPYPIRSDMMRHEAFSADVN